MNPDHARGFGQYDPAMSLVGPRRAALGGILSVFLLGVTGPAYADGSLQECIDRAGDHNGEPPTCTQVNGHWVASWPDDGAGGGAQGVIILLVVVGILITVGVTAWRVSTARRLASESGMDPGLATKMTLLSEDGLDATYLAANLRRPTPTTPTTTPTPASTPAAERLTELKGLLDTGLITQAEYDARRTAIIDAV